MSGLFTYCTSQSGCKRRCTTTLKRSRTCCGSGGLIFKLINTGKCGKTATSLTRIAFTLISTTRRAERDQHGRRTHTITIYSFKFIAENL